jgi:hypothetical protein
MTTPRGGSAQVAEIGQLIEDGGVGGMVIRPPLSRQLGPLPRKRPGWLDRPSLVVTRVDTQFLTGPVNKAVSRRRSDRHWSA